MGAFTYVIEVASTEAGPFETVEVLVDTGAFYTWLPRSIAERLGSIPRESQRFVLADGREIERDLAIIAVRLGGRTRPTLCVLGDEGSQPLLGVFTLEAFALAVDSVNKRLVPIPRLPMKAGAGVSSPHAAGEAGIFYAP